MRIEDVNNYLKWSFNWVRSALREESRTSKFGHEIEVWMNCDNYDKNSLVEILYFSEVESDGGYLYQVRHYYVIFLMLSKRKSIFSFSCHIFNFGEIQDGGRDGGHIWWRNRPPAAPHPIIYTSSCRVHHTLSSKGKNFSKYLGGGVASPHPPPRWLRKKM